jgi:hypothetical protein
VYVNKIGAFRPQNLTYVSIAGGGPDDVLCKRQPLQTRHPFNLVIAALIFNHLVSVTFQQLTLLSEDDIFAPGLLVAIVDDQHFHADSGRLSFLVCQILERNERFVSKLGSVSSDD